MSGSTSSHSMKTPEQYIKDAHDHIDHAQYEEATYMKAFSQLAQAEIAMATYLMTYASINR